MGNFSVLMQNSGRIGARLCGAFALTAALVALAGCGSAPSVQHGAGESAGRDSSRSLQFFVEGAMHDLRGEFDEAILEYEEAYRYDDAAPIAYAIAKDYVELRRGSRAAHYADIAVAGDSLNITYRKLRARIALNLQSDFPLAQSQYEAIVAIDSDDTQTLSDLAT